VDAPCSNLGVIRRRPDVKWNKTAEDPARLAEVQTRLLAAAARFVKPGGRLVYAVCTLTREETIGVTDRFWMNHPEFGLRPATGCLPETARALVAPDGMLRAWPHRHGTDAFFAALFERKPARPDQAPPSIS
jgi:16S rRNA (cytosine967-C5)-methyltransferase